MAEILPPSEPRETIDATCGVCGTASGHQLHLIVRHSGNERRVFRCSNCGTCFYDPLPDPDYSSHTDNELDRRVHVEQVANIALMLERIAPLVVNRPSGAFMDLGCGYGFAVDLVRHLFGWSVQGVEPSAYGRYGSQELGFPLLNSILTFDDPFEGKRFDLIHSSEVIEHTHDPAGFIDLILQYLTPDGCAVLTTPAAEALADPQYSVPLRLAFLSPGFHTYIFTADSLAHLLRSRGFTDVKVENRNGTLLAYASRGSLRLASVPNVNELLWRYYDTGLQRLAPDSPAGKGFGSRYFSSLVVHGKFEDAQRVWDWMSLKLPDEPPRVSTFKEYGAALPVAACELAYMRGALLLNDRNISERLAARLGLPVRTAGSRHAAHMFGLAFGLAKLKLKIAPEIALSEASLFWSARFHQAFALNCAGDRGEAAAIAREMLAPGSYAEYRPLVNDMDEELIRRTKELLPAE